MGTRFLPKPTGQDGQDKRTLRHTPDSPERASDQEPLLLESQGRTRVASPESSSVTGSPIMNGARDQHGSPSVSVSYQPLMQTQSNPLLDSRSDDDMNSSAPRRSLRASQMTPPNASRSTFFPPTEFEFSTYLFREFWSRLESCGYMASPKFAGKPARAMHVMVFRRFLRRLVDVVELNHDFDEDSFGTHGKLTYLQWEDIRVGINSGFISPVRYTFSERITLTLENQGSSWLAFFWSMLLLCCILGNTVIITLQSLGPPYCVDSGEADWEQCYHTADVGIVLLFSFEYFIKLLCSPLCRQVLLDEGRLLSIAVPDPKELAKSEDAKVEGAESQRFHMGKLSRVMFFVTKMDNLIDLVAIGPFWLELMLSDFMTIPLSFLRALRLVRFLRILKLGKLSTTIKVLGSTLWRSTGSVSVILIYFGMASVMVAQIILLMEPDNEQFENVPLGAWWVFSRMIGAHKLASYARGRPETVFCGTIMGLMCGFSKILWILPFGQIASVYKEEQQISEDKRLHRDQVEKEDAVKQGSQWMYEKLTACGTVYLLPAGDIDGVAFQKLDGTLLLPIMEDKSVDSMLTVALTDHKSVWIQRKPHPEIDFRTRWTPWKAGNGRPWGDLDLWILGGRNFDETLGKSWRVQVRVHDDINVHTQSDLSAGSWVSEPSKGSLPEPHWNQHHVFQVRWYSSEHEVHQHETQKMPEKQLLADLQAQSSTLQRHMRQLCAIQQTLNAKEDAVVGTWLYGSRPTAYHISRTRAGRLLFDGPHSAGSWASGFLRPLPESEADQVVRGSQRASKSSEGWLIADLYSEIGDALGSLRLCLDQEKDAISSNFRPVGSRTWSGSIIARRVKVPETNR